jgi:hypothetical protein
LQENFVSHEVHLRVVSQRRAVPPPSSFPESMMRGHQY